MAQLLVNIRRYRQSLWYDNVRHSLVTFGELQKLIDDDGLLLYGR